MLFTLTNEHIEQLFKLANFDFKKNEMILVGLRGATPVEISGTGFAAAHRFTEKGIDYLHMRCSLLQWMPSEGKFAAFPGSTVPYLEQIRKGVLNGGKGVNRLAPCFLTRMDHQDHRYFKGDHGLSSPYGPHRAFRNETKQPIWRTGDDADYQGDDSLMFQQAYDNIHCSRQTNVANSWYSSAGCQVVAGAAGSSITTSQATEQGPWKRFIQNAYSLQQKRFSYALFEEGEASRLAELGIGSRSPTVRFGSTGDLVKQLQTGLISNGYDVGAAGADGILGMGTLRALKAAQLSSFGKNAVDLIAGILTAEKLEIDWPKGSDSTVSSYASIEAAGLAKGDGVYNPKYGVTFESLTPSGYFSSDPDDLNVKRSLRTNNPGALNISGWQKKQPGFVGQTFADSAGNRTTIYRTPEHGIAAWYHLLSKRYKYGEEGTLRLATLARKYAGVKKETHKAVKIYISGWKRYSGNKLNAETRISLNDMEEVLLLARAMFAHELGSVSPISDEQILNAVRLKRESKLPA